jgi:hypothetical protein
MCNATFASAFNKLPGSKLREKISVNDPISRKLGYAGLADPLGDFMHRQAGTKSQVMQRAERIGDRQATAQRDAAYKAKVYEEPSAHVRAIAGRQG